MNKRQAKKSKKKVVIPFFMMDEMHLISMTEEEREVFYKERKEFIERYCHYKHYRDKNNIKIDRRKWFDSVCTVPTAWETQFENLFKHVRKREISVSIAPTDDLPEALRKVEEAIGLDTKQFLTIVSPYTLVTHHAKVDDCLPIIEDIKRIAEKEGLIKEANSTTDS